MASTYRIRLTLDGPLATPLVSGTIFGHLCWTWRQVRGEPDLTAWLEGLAAEPFLVSDGLPAGFLPRPLLRPTKHEDAETLEQLNEAKRRKKLAFVPVEAFLALRESLAGRKLTERLAKDPDPLLDWRVPHNTIDRHTGTTPKTGGLYFSDELWPKEQASSEWDVYVQTALDAGRLEELFGSTGKFGFGRDASSGRGRFRAKVEPALAGLFKFRGTHRLSLSHGSLTANMTEPRYRLHTHYGRLGSMYATEGSPFKYPLTLLRPGATFRATDAGPYGKLLGGVHPEARYAHVRHNAWHLTIPYNESE